MNSPAPTGRRNSIVEKVSIAKRRLSLESSDAVNDTLRKKFAHWTAPSTDGRRLSIDQRSDPSISPQNSEGSPSVPTSPYVPANPFSFIPPEANYAAVTNPFPSNTPVTFSSPVMSFAAPANRTVDPPVSCGLEAQQPADTAAGFQIVANGAPTYDFLGPPRMQQESPSLRSRRSGVIRFKTSSGGSAPMQQTVESSEAAVDPNGLLTSNERMLFQQPMGISTNGTPVSVGAPSAPTFLDPFADFAWADSASPAPKS